MFFVRVANYFIKPSNLTIFVINTVPDFAALNFEIHS